jgi:hypothetical protein
MTRNGPHVVGFAAVHWPDLPAFLIDNMMKFYPCDGMA